MAHVRRVGGKRGPSTSELWSAIKQLQHEKKVGKRERRRTGGRQGGKEEEREKERKKGGGRKEGRRHQ